MPLGRGGTPFKCQNCGLPTNRPVVVSEDSAFEKLRGKTVCQTCLKREGSRIMKED